MQVVRAASARLGEGGQQFLRFCAVGAVGFAVDAAVLTLVVASGSMDPIGGRLISFACAVMATFELNRRWAFRLIPPLPYITTLIAYLGVQGVGFVCNLAAYVVLYKLLPPPFNQPLLCLALASALALVVNFSGSRLMVFRRRA